MPWQEQQHRQTQSASIYWAIERRLIISSGHPANKLTCAHHTTVMSFEWLAATPPFTTEPLVALLVISMPLLALPGGAGNCTDECTLSRPLLTLPRFVLRYGYKPPACSVHLSPVWDATTSVVWATAASAFLLLRCDANSTDTLFSLCPCTPQTTPSKKCEQC